jgi:hypothetical protein
MSFTHLMTDMPVSQVKPDDLRGFSACLASLSALDTVQAASNLNKQGR